MSDDPLGSVSTSDMFDAIVSRLRDPEVVRIRRVVYVLGSAFLVLAVAVTIVAHLGWQTLLAFCSTFVPCLLIVRRISGRPLRPAGLRRRIRLR